MSKIVFDMQPDITKKDCYNIYLLLSIDGDNEYNNVAEPLKFTQYDDLDEEHKMFPEPSLTMSKDETRKFFASVLRTAKNCGMNFNEIVSDELKSVIDERDYLRHLVDKMLDIIEIIYKSPV